MKHQKMSVNGVFLFELNEIHDERGFFAVTWCDDDMRELGLESTVRQSNMSFNKTKGTVRGLHFQKAPYGETKLVRCTRGRLWDVVVDIRPDSPTYMQWCAAELSADNRHMLYIPEGCAHGFQTLEDDTEINYLVSQVYHPEAASGHRWNDPAFGVNWPLPCSVISDKDAAYPDYQPAATPALA